MSISTVCVLLLLTLSSSSAQAPGDEDSNCINDRDALNHPDNEKTLMDSYHYRTLLPGNGSGHDPVAGAVWNDRSVDGNDINNTNNPTYWQQSGGGGVCQLSVRVCGWMTNRDQNNWLFTQHIRPYFAYNYPVNIILQVIYTLVECRSRQGCKMGFRLLNYKTNTQQLPSTTGSGYMNTENYEQFGRARPSSTNSLYTETYSFTLDPSDTGFYVALRDIGTCVGISRLRVYHYICPSQQKGLVLYNETHVPESGSVNVNFNCVDNAESESDTVACNHDGTWGVPVCKCNVGYENKTTKCDACPRGKYRSEDDTTCQNCPTNTVMAQIAAPECECLDGYFRYKAGVDRPNVPGITWPSSDEGPSVGCSQPPNTPQNLRLNEQSTSISVSWSPSTGRSDLYYQVEYSPDISDTYVAMYTQSPEYNITFLRPFTSYCIRVSAHNGVSDHLQDPVRTVQKCTRTAQGKPGPVVDLQSHCKVILWQTPSEPNGVIINYQLNFTRNGETKTVLTEGPQTHFIVEKDSLPGVSGPFTVEVIAVNEADSGEGLCTLTIDLEHCSTEPIKCVLCSEQQVGLVKYPVTSAPEGSPITIAAQCVENAVSVTSLDVTCDSSGNWGNENPQCNCTEGFTPSPDNQKCLGSNPPPDPPTDPSTCLSCPEEIKTVIDANCIDVLIYWKPVSGAQRYRLRFHEKDDIFLNKTVDEYIFQVSLSDSPFKDKEMFSIEIIADLLVIDGNSTIQVDVIELTKECHRDSDRSPLDREDSEDVDPLSLAIAIVVTFVVTALLVAFLATTIGLVVNARKKRSGGKGDTNVNGMHSTSQYPMRDYVDTDEMK